MNTHPPENVLDDANRQRRSRWAVVCAIAVVLAAACGVVASSGEVPGWEEAMFHAINDLPDWLEGPDVGLPARRPAARSTRRGGRCCCVPAVAPGRSARRVRPAQADRREAGGQTTGRTRAPRHHHLRGAGRLRRDLRQLPWRRPARRALVRLRARDHRMGRCDTAVAGAPGPVALASGCDRHAQRGRTRLPRRPQPTRRHRRRSGRRRHRRRARRRVQPCQHLDSVPPTRQTPSAA